MIPPIETPTPGRKVLLLENIHEDAAKRFRDAGYDVRTERSSLSEQELISRMGDVAILGVRSKTQLTRPVVEASEALAAVGAFCIGTNQIDLDACLERGVAVFNAPFANTRSVVEMAIGEIIMMARELTRKDALLHQGVWEKRSEGAHEIRGKRLGILGYGNIGAQLSVLAESMGMEVWYYDVGEKLALGNARACSSMEELLSIADVVSVHVDGSPSNVNLIGEREFALMKDGAMFINLSRGFVVDLDALKAALESGKLRGAAIDVFPEEPKVDGAPFASPLLGLRNTILTPHIGGSTQEAQRNIGGFVPGKLLDFLEKGNSSLSVNFPNLQLPELQGTHRVVHVHRNVPGILARINQIMASREINITGQYLKTNEMVGYVITDLDQEYDHELAAALREIPDTIRVRVLY